MEGGGRHFNPLTRWQRRGALVYTSRWLLESACPAQPRSDNLDQNAMSASRLLFAALAGAFALSANASGDPVAGKQKVFQCMGCHGIPGWKTAFPEVYTVPKLGGQNAAYLVSALKAYQSGERDFPTMRAIAQSLSEKDMQDIAAYYAQAADKPAVAGK